MPSRVIISTVNPSTPANAAAPAFLADDCLEAAFDVALSSACPSRHMCTMSVVTDTAATIASTASHSD